MTISILHKFASAKADGPDASLVQPSNWNDTHAITQATNTLLGRTAAGSGVTQEVPFSADGLAILQATVATQKTLLGLAALAFKATVDATALIADNIITYSKIAASALASTNDVKAGTGSKLMTPDVWLSAHAWVTLTDAATVAVDHSTGVNFIVTLLGNRAIGTPANPKPGWPLNIRIKQDPTGGRTVAWAGDYDFGDYGVPAPSILASQEDLYCFLCVGAGKFIFTGIRKRSD